MAQMLWLLVLMVLNVDSHIMTSEDHPHLKDLNPKEGEPSVRARRDAADVVADGKDENKAKRRPEMDSSGFYGDTFSNGFGDFYTMKKAVETSKNYNPKLTSKMRALYEKNVKRRPEMDASGFYGDTFNNGFGDFYTMKKRRPEMDASGFYGDTFNSGFGDFYTMKRRPEMDASGFYGDTFHGGFGDFYTMKRNQINKVKAWRDYLQKKVKQAKSTMDAKRRPEMDASGFYGDTFNSGFGDFYTMKRN